MYRGRLRSYMDAEIRAIMSQYMPLESQQQQQQNGGMMGRTQFGLDDDEDDDDGLAGGAL